MRDKMLTNMLRLKNSSIVSTCLRSYSSQVDKLSKCPTVILNKGISYDDAFKTRKANLSKSLFAYYKNHVMIHQGYKQWVWSQGAFKIMASCPTWSHYHGQGTYNGTRLFSSFESSSSF